MLHVRGCANDGVTGRVDRASSVEERHTRDQVDKSNDMAFMVLVAAECVRR